MLYFLQEAVRDGKSSRKEILLNNNPNNRNSDNIDDILDILQKNKVTENNPSDAPTRIDSQAVKKSDIQKKPETKSAQTNTRVSSANNKPKPVTNHSYNASSTATVSLSDFDNMTKTASKIAPKKKKKKHMSGYAKVAIYLVAVLAISVFLSVAAIKIGNDVFAFVKADKEITVKIKEGATLADVSEELKEKGVIKYPSVYNIYARLRMDRKSYYTGNFLAGEHTLNSNLGYDKLIAKLAESTYSTSIVRVTIPEGFTAYEIIDLFVEKKVISSDRVDEFKEKLNTAAYEYDFLKDFDEIKDENGKVNSDRIYLLEGYLFPDTYDFYVGENLDSVIAKLLNNFDRKFEDAYYERCIELGMSIDEIVTLASMIEAEGNNAEDFYKISSVFHNRLNNAGSYPFLDSDATTLYSFQGEKKKLDAGDNKTREHAYNTYLNKGLPPGAICNPGNEAIHAALYPESTNYYFFYTNENGETIFSNRFIDHVNAYN